MAADGWNLMLTSRRGEVLAQIAADLSARSGVRVEVYPGDLALPGTPARIYQAAHNRGVFPDALVNNAAFGAYGFFKDQDPERLASMVEVNITSVLRLTSLFLPEMLARRSGYILNVASLASFQAVPLSGVYAATKAFILSWSLALAEELRGTGVTVTTLCPGVTRTNFQAAAGMNYLSRRSRWVMSSDAVARVGYRAMKAGRGLVVAGWHNKVAAQAVRLGSRALAARAAKKVMEGNLGL